jgi:hypothetical protein
MDLKTKNDKKSRKGRRYEHYIAASLRKHGWDVIDRGKYGYYDRGIDLIATKNGVTRYIQCKGWNYTFIIHENVVNQLYAAVASNVGQENLHTVEIYIYFPARLSNYAKAQADKLNVHFARKILPFWPRKKQY